MKIAIVPGSFDPMTLGHLDVVRYAAAHYDKVYVAVMVNREKKYEFSKEVRAEIARRTVAGIPNVEVIVDDGMLIDLYDRLSASAVCKGYRNQTDYDYEQTMAKWNAAHNPRFYTELIRADGKYQNVSSTEVRNALAKGAPIDSMVHPDAVSLILSEKSTDKGEKQ